jgi:hypothetical protein
MNGFSIAASVSECRCLDPLAYACGSVSRFLIPAPLGQDSLLRRHSGGIR